MLLHTETGERVVTYRALYQPKILPGMERLLREKDKTIITISRRWASI